MTCAAPGNRIGAIQRRTLYAIALGVLLSGLLWLLLDWLQVLLDSDSAALAIQQWALRVHGAAAMAMLVAVGALLPTHVAAGWALRRERVIGVANVAGAAVLAATGWGLYYAGSETLRARVSAAHWMVGIAAAMVLVWHVTRAKSARRARECA